MYCGAAWNGARRFGTEEMRAVPLEVRFAIPGRRGNGRKRGYIRVSTDASASVSKSRIACAWRRNRLSTSRSGRFPTRSQMTFGGYPRSDANNDNKVDSEDFGLLVNTYGAAAGDSDYNANADFNADGSVNVRDFGLPVNNYGRVGAP